MLKPDFHKGLIAAVDVGTTKVCCLIGKADRNGDPIIIGVGHNLSNGVKNGCITDIAQAKITVANAIETAEQMVGDRVESVYVNFGGSSIISKNLTASTSINNKSISDSDIRKLLDKALYKFDHTDRELIHCVPTSYIIDGEETVSDPRDMFAENLGVNIHTVTTAQAPIKNLETVIKNCRLGIAGTVVSPCASGISCLVEDEKELGATIIDMGGGTTSVGVYRKGQCIYSFSIPAGGHHVTQDIAYAFTTSLSHAERLKTLHGCALLTQRDRHEMLKVYPVGENEEANSWQVSRADLNKIIIARIQEIFDIVSVGLKNCGIKNFPSNRVVLTGGGSQLQGIREQASYVLNKQVRLGRPTELKGLPDNLKTASYATCAGLLMYAMKTHIKTPEKEKTRKIKKSSSKFERIGQWLLQNF